MAVTAATKTTDFNAGFLPPSVAAPIFEHAAKSSVVQQLARQVPLSINGVNVPVVTERPVAGWVAEGARKPASKGNITIKQLVPKKLAVIVVVSQEVVRANPAGYMDMLRPDIGQAFATAFDMAALHGAGPDGTVGGGPFSTNIDQTTKTVEFGTASQATGSVYGDLVAAMKQIVSAKDAGGRPLRLTGFAFDDVAEPILLAATDTTGRPLFVDTIVAQEGSTTRGTLLRRPAVMGEGVAYDGTVGYAGDWTQAVWGQIGGIEYSVEATASVTINGSLVSLWENNLVAIRAETEYAFLVNDTAAFVELENVVS